MQNLITGVDDEKSGAAPAMSPTELVAEWTLEGHSTTVTCVVARSTAGFWVAVGMNDDMVLKELHARRRVALNRAAEMEARLLAQGFRQPSPAAAGCGLPS
jgi:hypothetical protein